MFLLYFNHPSILCLSCGQPCVFVLLNSCVTQRQQRQHVYLYMPSTYHLNTVLFYKLHLQTVGLTPWRCDLITVLPDNLEVWQADVSRQYAIAPLDRWHTVHWSSLLAVPLAKRSSGRDVAMCYSGGKHTRSADTYSAAVSEHLWELLLKKKRLHGHSDGMEKKGNAKAFEGSHKMVFLL